MCHKSYAIFLGGTIVSSDIINAVCYRINNLELLTHGHLTEHEIETAWFQQDSTATFTAAASFNYFKDFVANNLAWD